MTDVTPHALRLVTILAVGFTLASILGYLSERLKLTPLLGYMIAGYIIGPYSPGFAVDLQIAEQMTEVGVVLMMFGVGLHLNLSELSSVKRIAIPGALGQTCITAAVSAVILHLLVGWSIEASILFGFAIGVASTVVLIRVLSENQLVTTPTGHITLGWLIAEDFITVLVLVLLPAFISSANGSPVPWADLITPLLLLLIKFLLPVVLLFAIGKYVISGFFTKIHQTSSHELMTLAILALMFLIAVGTAALFGTSIALGAFIAGMLIGQTRFRVHVDTTIQPLKDMFAVLFFLAIGMLFNPEALLDHIGLFLLILVVILVIKPLLAYGIVRAFKHTHQTALVIAIALAQIGEFSFILAEETTRFKILPEDGYDIIVACALVSLAINPILFKYILRKNREKGAFEPNIRGPLPRLPGNVSQ